MAEIKGKLEDLSNRIQADDMLNPMTNASAVEEVLISKSPQRQMGPNSNKVLTGTEVRHV